METSKHVTKEILQATVAAELGVDVADVVIESFSVKEGANKGDNYACVMKAVDLTATVRGEERKMHYMAKCMPTNEMRAQYTQEGMFDPEIAMYAKILPRLEKIDREQNFSPRISAPKVFYADSKSGVMVMEDLKRQGYYMVDKIRGLDMTQLKLALEQLAILHATSYHFITTYPEGLEKYKEDHQILSCDNWMRLEEIGDKFHEMLDLQVQMLISIVEEHATDDPDLVRRLREFVKVRKDAQNAAHHPKGAFNCILHNDAWCNNFLFNDRTDEGMDKIKMLDFQLSRRARPTVDLVYFFGSSTTPEFRRDHLDHLLGFYHARLVMRLCELGYEESLYPFEQLMADYKECLPHGFVMSIMHTIMQLTPAENEDATFDPEKMTDEAAAEVLMEKMKDAQLELCRKNHIMRNRFISIAKEAARVGLI